MQEKYLGDSHDFLKYAYLRWLNSRLGLRIGVNWYRTDPISVDKVGNNDGNKRHHLKNKAWSKLDRDLLERITALDNPTNRKLSSVSELGILPVSTGYFSELLTSMNRTEWHAAALQSLKPYDLVFLDPDNGFEVPSMSIRSSPKYATYAEAADYVEAGKTVVCIQFARQCDPISRGHHVRDRLLGRCSSAIELPILRGRLAPNLLFVTVSPEGSALHLAEQIKLFAEQSTKIEIIE